jgi:cation:H+ antiporter
MALLLTLAGLASLVAGAELLVRGAVGLALRTGLSTVVIGLTVVAMGTGAPEFAVGISSARSGEVELALGNVVGSNTANVLLVLGLAAALSAAGLAVTERVVRLDVPIMIAVSIGVFLMALNGSVSRLEGVLLLGGIVAYTVWTVQEAGEEYAIDGVPEVLAEFEEAVGEERRQPLWRSLLLLLAGIGLLVAGAESLVEGASRIALALGVSELLIGLTVVAVGTTAPEIATSAVAALRGEADLAVGNVIGSNLFNLLGVLGITATVSGTGLPVGGQALRVDLPVMVAVAIACLPVFFNGFRLTRAEGTVFVIAYGAYLGFLVLEELDSPALPAYVAGLVVGAVVAVIALVISGVHGLRSRHGGVRR